MMSTALISSLNTLPNELLYRIFDNLDIQVIVLSLYHVSKRLDTIVNAYFHQTRYKLNFECIPSNDFIQICRLIQPSNVISLTLSDQSTKSNQIPLFLSYFSIEQFTQLRSLTLLNIENKHLEPILKHAVTCSLISLSIQMNQYSNRSTTSDALLSKIIQRSGLQNLTLNLREDGTDQIEWPTLSTIQQLTLYYCHVKCLPTIFRHFSSLRTLFIRHVDLHDYEHFGFQVPLDLKPIYQLTFLIMEDSVIKMSEMILILSNTPSLTHLRLTGIIDSIDFNWEQLIQAKLPLLNEFEFSFYTKIYDNNVSTSTSTEILVASFRTSFWLEIKKWFVTCGQIRFFNNHDGNLGCDIYLYTIPVYNYYSQSYSDSIRMTSSISVEMDNHVAVINDMHTMPLKTEKMMMPTTTSRNLENTPEYLHHKTIAQTTYLFRTALNLNIRINSTWSIDFVQRLSSLIDLSYLKKVTLIDEFSQDFYPNMTTSFVHLLEKAYNIHSLVITKTWRSETCQSNMENFCSIIPHHIDHLEIDVTSMNDMYIILNRLEHLSSMTFRFSDGENHWQTKIMEQISTRRYSTCYPNLNTLQILFDKNKSRKP